MITITATNGRSTKIASRNEAGQSLPPLAEGFEREAGRITLASSTEAQPFICANYDGERFVGGSTMTQGLVDLAIAKAKKAGFTIEGSL